MPVIIDYFLPEHIGQWNIILPTIMDLMTTMLPKFVYDNTLLQTTQSKYQESKTNKCLIKN